MAENNRPEVTFQTLLLNNKNDQKDNKKDLDKIHIIIATITIILSIAFMALAWYFNQTQYKYNYFIMLAVLFYMVNLGLSIYLLLPYNDITVKRKISAFCFIFLTLLVLLIMFIMMYPTHSKFMIKLNIARNKKNNIHDTINTSKKEIDELFDTLEKGWNAVEKTKKTILDNPKNQARKTELISIIENNKANFGNDYYTSLDTYNREIDKIYNFLNNIKKSDNLADINRWNNQIDAINTNTLPRFKMAIDEPIELVIKNYKEYIKYFSNPVEFYNPTDNGGFVILNKENYNGESTI